MKNGVRTIAFLQLRALPSEPRQERVERVLRLLDEAPVADLVVLPELWSVGYFFFDDYRSAAEPLDGPLVRRLAAKAENLATVVVGGSVVESCGDRLFNTIPVLGADGALLGSYRKRHLFGCGSQEAALLTPGHEVSVVTTPVGQLGLASCFDLRFAQHFADLRTAGADLLVVPSAWPVARAEHWEILVRARAIETQTPIVAVNGVGPSNGVPLGGASMVIDARGRTAGHARRRSGWCVATLDLQDTEAWRTEFPVEEVSQHA